MSYKVINEFIDKEQNNAHFKVGDTYPKDGYEVNEERVAFLMQKHKKYQVAFIEEVIEQPKRKSKKSPSKRG